jgi:prolyl oligopeptidase
MDSESPDDPHRWLEDIDSDASLAWVRARNAESRAKLEAWPRFTATRDALRSVLDATDRIPHVARRGEHLYNFWQDEDHPRGLWRRTTLDGYRKPDPAWDVLLDLDALGRDEGESWTFAGVRTLPTHPSCALVLLSRGGADAVVVREFDLDARQFRPGGFELPEAKTQVAWLDRDTLLVGTDFGPGSMTASGYPRTLKRWSRGQPLAEAPLVFEGRTEDVDVSPWVDFTPGFERVGVMRSVDFFRTDLWLLEQDRLVPIDKPDDAGLRLWKGQVLIELRSDWALPDRTWPQGALLAADFERYQRGERSFTALFLPTDTGSLAGITTTREHVLLSQLDNVQGRLDEWRLGADGQWALRRAAVPGPGTLSVSSWHDPMQPDDPLADAYTLTYGDLLQPETLYLAEAGHDRREVLKRRRPQFEADGCRVEQCFATSADGTRIPYFLAWPRGAQADGRNPTLLVGYGGFELSLEPGYSGTVGRGWLAEGGVYVLANIRGGGEFGPRWHQAALREKRQNAFDDFCAVADDLIRRRVTRPSQLGIQGGSNGGLLVAAAMLQRPDLFGAVACAVPLLDMRRYHELLAGASWIAEYGNPDEAADWAFISRYSPYQNVRAGVTLPPVFFTTSTRDDRVHPGHARKMAARMIEQGHRVLVWENIEGGHAGATDNAQRADTGALEYAFLWQALADEPATQP